MKEEPQHNSHDWEFFFLLINNEISLIKKTQVHRECMWTGVHQDRKLHSHDWELIANPSHSQFIVNF